MCHLIGLAGTKRLVTVMRALSSQGIVVRGLFGETSRAIGAFVQVSVPSDSVDIFVGACEYLIHEERIARESMSVGDALQQIVKVRDYAIGSHSISLSDALRVLGWIRLGSVLGIEGAPLSARTVDSWLTTIELRSPMDERRASIDRASWLRVRLESC
jgi:protein arginine kinase